MGFDHCHSNLSQVCRRIQLVGKCRPHKCPPRKDRSACHPQLSRRICSRSWNPLAGKSTRICSSLRTAPTETHCLACNIGNGMPCSNCRPMHHRCVPSIAPSGSPWHPPGMAPHCRTRNGWSDPCIGRSRCAFPRALRHRKNELTMTKKFSKYSK